MKKLLQIIKKIIKLFKKKKSKTPLHDPYSYPKDPYEEQINQMIYEGSPVRDE